MNGLRKFENRLESMVSGVFARTFRSAVQPVEISAALNREVDNNAQILSRDRRLVPNQFSVELSDTDFERLDSLGPQLNRELVELLREHASDQSYVFTGPVSIEIETGEDLSTGRFRVKSKAVSSVSAQEGDPTDSAVRRATASLEVNGQHHPLNPPGLVVGRGNDVELRVDDPGVSRRHAEFQVVQHGLDIRVTVRDLGSTNGISVNGRRTEQATLVDGAQVRVGNTTLTLHLGDAR